MKWLVVGVSGVTCGGKTTVAKRLKEIIPNSCLISQDYYFHPIDSNYHTWIPDLNHINWEIMSSLDMEKMLSDINDILNCKKNVQTDFAYMKHSSGSENSQSLTVSVDDKNEIVNAASLGVHNGEGNDEREAAPKSWQFLSSNICNVMIIEGFLIFNYKPVAQLCNLKFYVTLTKDQCFSRRRERAYDPPDVPGYFELCVWPEYEKHLNDVKSLSDVHYINGMITTDTSIIEILKFISNFFESDNRKVANNK